MEWLWKKPWLLLMGVTVLVQVLGSSSGCVPEEKRSLPDIKAAYSNEFLLPSWVNDPKSNCCDWERLTCDSFTGHVIDLSLESLNSYHGRSNILKGSGSFHRTSRLNGSLFLSFKHMRNLNLSNNCFDDIVWKGGT